VRQEVAQALALRDGLQEVGDLRHLFRWSSLVHVDDVPDDLLRECVWSLEIAVQAFEDSSEAQLCAAGLTAGEGYEHSQHIMFLNSKIKLAMHLLKAPFDRPADTAKHLRYAIDYSKMVAPSIDCSHPEVVITLAEALIRSGTDLKAAKQLLRDQLTKTSELTVEHLVRSRIWLAHLARIQGDDGEAKKLEEWLVKWFRKNPHTLRERVLRKLLIPGGETSSPVLEALGGVAWLSHRKHTDKTDLQRVKCCRQCEAREPLVKLSLCGRCKRLYFCSVECQKKNWPFHKNVCSKQAGLNDMLAELSLTAPAVGQRDKDFRTWLNLFDMTAVYSALGLHRDPARGPAHIAVLEVFYTPTASQEACTKFRVLRCGVFRIADMYGELERILRIDYAPQFVENLLADLAAHPRAAERISHLYLCYGKGVMPYVGAGAVHYIALQEQPYNPEWRKALNPMAPPAMIQLSDASIKDAEHIF